MEIYANLISSNVHSFLALQALRSNSTHLNPYDSFPKKSKESISSKPTNKYTFSDKRRENNALQLDTSRIPLFLFPLRHMVILLQSASSILTILLREQ